jgi:hypothetical protein
MNGVDKEILENQTDEVLAKWGCAINSWGWPEEMPSPEDPKDWAEGRRNAIQKWIIVKIGLKACLREWNRERMNDAEFVDFWEKNGEKVV